jgi:signal transduction histidine kinase
MSETGSTATAAVEQSGWVRYWHVVVYLSLVAATAVAVADADLSSGRKTVVIALGTALVGWYALIAQRWRYWQLPRLQFAATLVVAAMLWVPLLLLHDAFTITVFAAYAVAACPFLGRAIATVAVLTALLLLVGSVGDNELGATQAASIIITGAAVLGVHGIFARIRAQSEERRQLLEHLQATQAELAIRERQAGALDERHRLARDIHDSLAQGFTSIVMLLEAADARLDPDAVDVRARIDQARQTARDNLAEARRVVWSLRPQPLERGALLGALELLVDRTATETGLDIDIEVTGDAYPLAAEHELALYRAAQEILANVRKHAHASRVVCTVTFLDDQTILDVSDDGRGFDPAVTAPTMDGGLGLAGLDERVIALGGTVDVDSQPGEGTTITVAIPTPMAVNEPAPADHRPSS